jgi:hypothetical protein
MLETFSVKLARDTFSSKHRLVIYPDGIARETIHFIAGLLGDE